MKVCLRAPSALAEARRVWVVATVIVRGQALCQGRIVLPKRAKAAGGTAASLGRGRWQRTPRTPQDVSAASRGEASRPSAALINYCRRSAGTDLQTTVELNRGLCEPRCPRAYLVFAPGVASTLAGLHAGRFARPNVRAETGPTAGRQARAGENVPRTARPGLVACRCGST